jgi:hypothetical protein
MTTLQSAESLAAFHKFVSELPATPEVCPKSPSQWAAHMLNFHTEGRQKDVLDDPAHRLILCCARQWGKTTVIAVKALHAALAEPGAEILVLSTSERQAGLLVQQVIAMATRLQLPRQRVHGYEFSLQLPNGSKIFAVATSETTGGRGPSASTAMVADHVIAAATPSLTRTSGRLWLLSTPHGQSGLFYNVWHNEDLPHWVRVKVTIDDMPHATHAFIEEQRNLFPLSFRQEFYCEFIPPDGRLLSREELERMFDFARAYPLIPLNGPG